MVSSLGKWQDAAALTKGALRRGEGGVNRLDWREGGVSYRTLLGGDFTLSC